MLGKLDRIAHQVGQYLPQAAGIPDQRSRQMCRHKARQLQTLAVGEIAEQLRHLFHYRSQIECTLLELDLAGFDLGEIEHPVDDPEQCLGRSPRGPDKSLLRGSELGLADELQHPQDPVERRPYLVAHIGQKLRLRPDRALQLDRSLRDPGLERHIQMT